MSSVNPPGIKGAPSISCTSAATRSHDVAPTASACSSPRPVAALSRTCAASRWKKLFFCRLATSESVGFDHRGNGSALESAAAGSLWWSAADGASPADSTAAATSAGAGQAGGMASKAKWRLAILAMLASLGRISSHSASTARTHEGSRATALSSDVHATRSRASSRRISVRCAIARRRCACSAAPQCRARAVPSTSTLPISRASASVQEGADIIYSGVRGAHQNFQSEGYR